MNDIDSSVFERNLSIFTERDALTAFQIRFRESDRLQFCQTEQGEMNLTQTKYGLTDYYHSPKGALEEAKNALKEEDLQKTQVIYFYGIGLGYFYEALLPWLQERQERHLVFLEDDIEVLAHLFQTEQALSLLQNPQVTLFYFTSLDTDKLRFYQLISRFINTSTRFLALPYYAQRKERESLALCYQILYDQSWVTSIHNEYGSGQSGFIGNFYANLLYLPESCLATPLLGKCNNVPAIICGAGPSLEKNIDLLKNLHDRALIFAGGSSLNVLSAHGVLPHFGLGIDPNPEQFHRLLTNHAFHIPFFYRQRLAYTAFQMIQGPKLYVPGSSNQLATWFEQKLKLEGPWIDEGHNVVNFCTGIATAMGCNPIIFVGMDLAFTATQTYAKGIGTHPLWLGRSTPYAPEPAPAVSRLSVTGEKVMTKWDWISEAEWLSYYARKHPHIRMINATEGGLGFFNIPNHSLQSISETELTRSYDFEGILHTEIEQSRLQIDRPAIITLLQEFKSSLERCRRYCIDIIQEESAKAMTSSEESSSLYTPQAKLNEHSLHEEEGYRYFLEILDKSRTYLNQAAAMGRQIPWQMKIYQIVQKYQFLIEAIEQHLKLMNEAVQQFIFAAVSPLEQRLPLPSDLDEVPRDLFQELALPYGSKHQTEFYSNGTLKQETFYEESQLHGPSRFYSKAGKLLAEGWFIRGLREGESRQFYASGALYSCQNYLEGMLQGKQQFFFENGQPQLILHYAQGLLDGTVNIYNSSGVLIRELHYKQGMRHDVEHLWDNQGVLLMECFYEEGIPVGTAREWDFRGKLRREIQIHQFPKDFDLSVWDENEIKIQSFQHGIEDYSSYFSSRQNQANFIEGAIELIMKRFYTLLEEHPENISDPAFMQDLAKLETSIQDLHTMKQELQSIMDTTLQRAEEALKKYHEDQSEIKE